MKPLALIILLSITGVSLYAQQPSVKINLKDGSQQVIQVDSISSVTPHRSGAEINVRFHAQSTGLGNPQEFDLADIDSLSFGDSSGTRLMYLWGLDWIRSPFAYQIGGFPTSKYGARIDSITFQVIHKNANISKLTDDAGFFHCSANAGHSLFASGSFRDNTSLVRYTMQNSIGLDSRQIEVRSANIFSLAANVDERHIAYVKSSEWGISLGQLWERDVIVDTAFLLDTLNVSSVVYVRNTDDRIYYSYGHYTRTNTHPNDAGYYLLRKGQAKERILNYISEIGPGETVNGFDVSANGGVIYIPVVYRDRPPVIVHYDVGNSHFDTIDVAFSRQRLWLRLSETGDTLLYCNYSNSTIDDAPIGVNSEIGIIDLATKTKRVLDTAPDDASTWSMLFPQWAPAWNSITYVASPVSTEPAGTAVLYQLYVLKSFP